MNVFELDSEFGPWKSIDVGLNNRKNISSSSSNHCHCHRRRRGCRCPRYHTERAHNWSPLCKDVQIVHKSADITVPIDNATVITLLSLTMYSYFVLPTKFHFSVSCLENTWKTFSGFR
jgi:hypothetical protein